MQNVKNTILIRLLQALAPHPCVSCGVIGVVLCQRCKYNYLVSWSDRCVACTEPKGCCAHADTWISYIFDRVGPIQSMIDSYKFRYRIDTAELLAGILAERLPTTHVLVPIPTLRAHIRQRGFDHIDVLVRKLAHIKGVPVERVLVRTNNTVMHRLAKQDRLLASKGLFTCSTRLNPTTQYVLIDDIHTTGATLRAARQTLLGAGACSVQAVVVARQPLGPLD